MSVSETIQAVEVVASDSEPRSKAFDSRPGRKNVIQSAQLKALAAVMASNGQSTKTIANKLGITAGTVRRWSKAILDSYPNLPEVLEYDENRADLVAHIEGKALKSIHDKIDKPNVALKDATLAFKVLHTAGRLERGLSSQNISQKVDISFTSVNPAHISDSDDD